MSILSVPIHALSRDGIYEIQNPDLAWWKSERPLIPILQSPRYCTSALRTVHENAFVNPSRPREISTRTGAGPAVSNQRAFDSKKVLYS